MNTPSTSFRPLVLLGAGGHAKVLVSLIQALGRPVAGVCDPSLARQGATVWRGLPVLGGDEALDRFDPSEVELVNGLGQLVGGVARERLFASMAARGFHFPALVHPAAWVDPTSRLAEGVQVMAGTVVQADVRIGDNSILNTGARIDHDCVVGDHVHVAPGATLCGTVHVGARAFLGAGSTVVQGLRLGEGSVVGAGSTVRHDLEAGQRWLGGPPRSEA
jgi:UDP-perosamine 4-acetyltransferase